MGVPLFVEEVIKTVLESGVLQVWEESSVLTTPLPPLAIPVMLHDALPARAECHRVHGALVCSRRVRWAPD